VLTLELTDTCDLPTARRPHDAHPPQCHASNRGEYGPFTAVTFVPHAASAQPPVDPKQLAETQAHYTKYEYRIPMRDGVKLFTAVYVAEGSKQEISDLAHADAVQRAALRSGSVPVHAGPVDGL